MLARLIGLMLFVSPILSSAEAAAQTPFRHDPGAGDEAGGRRRRRERPRSWPPCPVRRPHPVRWRPRTISCRPGRRRRPAEAPRHPIPAPALAPFDIGVPPAAPPPAPAATPPAAAPTETAKIDRFIVPFATLRLNGEMDRQAWTVSLTADEAERPASIVVTYVNSVLVMPEASRLLVTVNSQSVIEAPLAASDRPARLSVAIPSGLLKTGPNLIQFDVKQRHRTDCTLASTYELWTEIDSAGTGFLFAGGNPPAPASLDDLAAVGFDGKGNTNIRLVVPHRDEIQGGADLLRLVQAIALRGQYPHPVVTVTDEADAPPALGTLARRRCRGFCHAASRCRVAATGLTTLVVSGPTWSDVVAAINEIASVVQRPFGAALDLHHLILACARPRIEPEFDGRRFHAKFHVALPADFYANAYGEAQIYLDAAYTGEVKPGGHIDIYVNGFVASNVPLTSTAGDIFRRLPIKVPLTHFRPG